MARAEPYTALPGAEPYTALAQPVLDIEGKRESKAKFAQLLIDINQQRLL
jgi:hypothetical protein